MGKLKNISFLCFLAFGLIFSMVNVVAVRTNFDQKPNKGALIEDLCNTPETLEDTFYFIINRLNNIRSSANFAIDEGMSANSYKFTASAGDESVNVDESYHVKNIINPHQTNQSEITQELLPKINRTSVEIIMGFTYQLIEYNWEISWTLELFGFKIAYAYFGIELDIGAGMRFPINVTIDYLTEMLVGQYTPLNITLQTLDLPNFNETYFHFITRIYAGVSAFGQNGEWSIGPNYREDRSYETPLGAGTSVELGEIQIPILEILGHLNIPYVSQIANIIASYVVDLLLKLRFSVGSDLLSMKATLFGNDTHFDDMMGPTSKTLNFTEAPETKSLYIYAVDPGPIRLELNEFKYYLNKLNIEVLLGLTWKTVFSYLFDDMEWSIYKFTIPLGNLFIFESSNTVTVQMNGSKLPDIYGVDVVYISPMESIELGKDVATYFVFLENTGQNIEHDTYDIEITGLNPSWVIHPPYLTIKQGSIGYFILKIDPPRESSSTAGVKTFNVTATSRGDPSKKASVTQSLNILPYYEAKVERTSLLDTGILDVEPGIPANLTFMVTNTGNIAENFTVTMMTEGLASSIFEISPNIYLNPGESIIINPNITVPKSYEFPALRYSVKLAVQSMKNPSSVAYDTAQMNILPYKNLSVTFTEKSIPTTIRPGSLLEYEVHILNNGNFNDTIDLSLEGLSPSSYEFGEGSQIIFPGQELTTTLRITIPRTGNSMQSVMYNLTLSAQFASNQTLSFEQSILIYTTPNYLPLILSLVIVGAVIASSPYVYKKVSPYIKRRLKARSLAKLRTGAAPEGIELIKIRLETCPFCYRDLTEGELNALNSGLDTLCEKCGNILHPEYLEVTIPKQRSIDEIVSEKMKKYRKKSATKTLKDLEEEHLERKSAATKKIKQIQRQPIEHKTSKIIEVKFCPKCYKNLSEIDISLLLKGEMTFCGHCKKILKPEDFGIKVL
ncbi:MAG: COG1470 family protein [Candidatus Helarchaeota archaeon]